MKISPRYCSILLACMVYPVDSFSEGDSPQPSAFPEMRTTGSLPRHQVAMVLLEKRRGFQSCHESLKARKIKSSGKLSFEEARRVDSGVHDSEAKIQTDGVRNSTSFSQGAPSPSGWNLSGDISFHFTIQLDGSVKELRTSRSEVGDNVFVGCLEKVIAGLSFSSSQTTTEVSFLVLRFSAESGYQQPQ